MAVCAVITDNYRRLAVLTDRRAVRCEFALHPRVLSADLQDTSLRREQTRLRGDAPFYRAPCSFNPREGSPGRSDDRSGRAALLSLSQHAHPAVEPEHGDRILSHGGSWPSTDSGALGIRSGTSPVPRSSGAGRPVGAAPGAGPPQQVERELQALPFHVQA